MARQLHKRGLSATAIGIGTAGERLRNASFNAADVIILTDAALLSHLPSQYHRKVLVLSVGTDIWVNPYAPQLERVCNGLLDFVGSQQGKVNFIEWHPIPANELNFRAAYHHTLCSPKVLYDVD